MPKRTKDEAEACMETKMNVQQICALVVPKCSEMGEDNLQRQWMYGKARGRPRTMLKSDDNEQNHRKRRVGLVPIVGTLKCRLNVCV